jgi:hypothetical protein
MAPPPPLPLLQRTAPDDAKKNKIKKMRHAARARARVHGHARRRDAWMNQPTK